jgi:hypothetical protein
MIAIFIYTLVSLLVFVKGFWETKKKNNVFRETAFLSWMGIFVWGDALIFGPFWFIASLFCLLLNDWLLFVLIIVTFWFIRSLGETIYWLNQQFSLIKRNPPEKMFGFSLCKNDAVYFFYQIFWQCITVVSLILLIFVGNLWLKSH